MAKIKVRPLDDRVVIRPAESEEVTAGGIVLPDSAKEKPQRGTVIACGSGRLLESCLLYTSPSPRDATLSRMPSSA